MNKILNFLGTMILAYLYALVLLIPFLNALFLDKLMTQIIYKGNIVTSEEIKYIVKKRGLNGNKKNNF